MTTSIIFLVSFILIINLLSLCILGFFLVELFHVNLLAIQAILDMFRAEYNVSILGADIPLAMANALGIPIPSGDDDPEKHPKTGYNNTLDKMDEIKKDLAGLGGIYLIKHLPSNRAYVGQTILFPTRFSQHIRHAING